MNDPIQNKLFNYAPPPPTRVWEAIETVLEKGQPSAFAEQLANLEVAPPPTAWDRIEKSLAGSGKLVEMVPFTRRYRLMAAAAILLIVASSLWLLNNNSASLPATVSTMPSVPPVVNKILQPSEQKTASTAAVQKPQPAATAQSNNLPTANKAPRKKLLARRDAEPLIAAASFIPSRAEARQTVDKDDHSEQYMIYSDGEGTAMRLSKKIYNLIACVKADLICQQRMKQLQQKFASASLTADFTGVVEVVRNLKENQ